MLNCKEAVRLMSDEMDRDILLGERLSLRFHTLICTGCSNYREQMAFLRKACQESENVAADG